MVEYIPCFSAPELHWDLLPATRLASRNILIEQNIKKQTGTALCVYNLLGLYSVQCTVCTVYIYWHWQTTQQTLKGLECWDFNPLVLRGLADISSSNLVVPLTLRRPCWHKRANLKEPLNWFISNRSANPMVGLKLKKPVRLMFEKELTRIYLIEFRLWHWAEFEPILRHYFRM